MEVQEGGDLGGHLEGRTSFFVHYLWKPGVKSSCSGEGIGEGLISYLLSLFIHEADGIVFGTHITTNKQVLWQGVHLLSSLPAVGGWIGVVKRGPEVVSKTASPIRTLPLW